MWRLFYIDWHPKRDAVLGISDPQRLTRGLEAEVALVRVLVVALERAVHG